MGVEILLKKMVKTLKKRTFTDVLESALFHLFNLDIDPNNPIKSLDNLKSDLNLDEKGFKKVEQYLTDSRMIVNSNNHDTGYVLDLHLIDKKLCEIKAGKDWFLSWDKWIKIVTVIIAILALVNSVFHLVGNPSPKLVLIPHDTTISCAWFSNTSFSMPYGPSFTVYNEGERKAINVIVEIKSRFKPPFSRATIQNTSRIYNFNVTVDPNSDGYAGLISTKIGGVYSQPRLFRDDYNVHYIYLRDIEPGESVEVNLFFLFTKEDCSKTLSISLRAKDDLSGKITGDSVKVLPY